MNNIFKYITVAILLGLASGAVAEPYSQTWEDSNVASAAKPSSEYTLGWQDTQTKSPAPAPKAAAAVEAPVAVNLAQLPGLIMAAGGQVSGFVPAGVEVASAGQVATGAYAPRALRGPSSVSVPTYDHTLHAERYFDNYADNYRYVSKVEVVVWRGNTSYPGTDVYENYAQYSVYDVYINDLKPGDRYEVRVTWDDGKYRCIERSVDRYTQRNVRVNSPG